MQYTANCLLDDTNTENQSEQLQEIEKGSGSNKQDGNDSNDNDDQWTEDEAETPTGVTDTMLTNTYYFEDSLPQRILAKLQNTPQLISASLTCVGRL